MFKDEKDLTSFINEAEQNQIFDIQAEKSSIWNYNANKQVGQYATLVPAQNNPSNQLATNNFYHYTHQYSKQQDYNPPWQANQEIAAREYINNIAEKNRVMSILKEAKANEDEQFLRMKVAEASDSLSMFHLPQEPVFLPAYMSNLGFQLRNDVAFLTYGTKLSATTALLSAIVAVSIAVGNKVKIQCSKDWFEATAINIIVSALSATRKSVVVERGHKPFNTFLKEKNKDVIKQEKMQIFMKNVLKKEEKELIANARLKMKEATTLKQKYEILKSCAEDSIEGLAVVPQNYSIFLNTFTRIGLLKHFQKNNEQLGVITPEADAINSLLFDKKNDPSFFNKLFNQEMYTQITASKEYSFSKPTLSMLSFIQPNIAKKVYSNKCLCETGASARILPYFEPLNGNNEFSVDFNSIGERYFNDKILSILNLYHNENGLIQYTATLTPEAYNRVKNFESDIANRIISDSHPGSHACLRKLHGYAVRFAWAIHLLYTDNFHETPISLESMNMAIDLCYTLLPHIEYAYNPTGLEAEEAANLIIEFFQKVDLNLGTLTYGYTDSRTIQQRIHKNSKQTKHGLEKLQVLGYVRIIDAGRVKSIVVPHPRLLGRQQNIILDSVIPNVKF